MLQLKELHRVAEVQSRLHPCGSATAGPASADSHSSWQQASLNGHSFSGLHPEKQRPKNAWWLNSGAWDPSLAIGLATWQPSVSEALPTSQRKVSSCVETHPLCIICSSLHSSECISSKSLHSASICIECRTRGNPQKNTK